MKAKKRKKPINDREKKRCEAKIKRTKEGSTKEKRR